MLTTDFTGTYNYAVEEANAEADSMLEDFANGYYRTKDELHQAVIKTRDHWIKVFNDVAEMGEFADAFNAKCYATFGFAM